MGSRWLSPKASAGGADGECVCMWWGWREGVCVLEVAGVSVCMCECVCRFSAWKGGWRSASAEELLLVTVRERREEG